MARTVLTDTLHQLRKRNPAKGRADYPDALVPGLAL